MSVYHGNGQMSSAEPSEGTLQEADRTRIGEPQTDDEVRGYWLFVVGSVLGFLSIVLFLASSPSGGLRQGAIVLGGIGLVLLLVGPTLRLPLQDSATRLVYGGSAIAGLGVLYFIVVFPDNWSLATGNTGVITL